MFKFSHGGKIIIFILMAMWENLIKNCGSNNILYIKNKKKLIKSKSFQFEAQKKKENILKRRDLVWKRGKKNVLQKKNEIKKNKNMTKQDDEGFSFFSFHRKLNLFFLASVFFFYVQTCEVFLYWRGEKRKGEQGWEEE